MDMKTNKYLSFELIFALLFIIAFFLPWVDMGLIKIIGWDLPSVQKTMTKIGNLFSRNKTSIYTTYTIYGIPMLSLLSIISYFLGKQKISRILLLLSSISAFILSIYLFFKVPKADSGIYVLCISSFISLFYLFFSKRNNFDKEKENIIDENIENE